MPIAIDKLAKQIRPIFRHHNLPEPREIVPMHGGIVNAIFAIDNTHIIRFSARDTHVAKFAREAACYRYLANVVPLPTLYLYDDSYTHVGCEYLIIEKLPGQSLGAVWDTLTMAQREAAAYEAGNLLAKMHNVEIGAGFGRMEDRTYSTWPAFLRQYMQENLSASAEFECISPLLARRIKAAITNATWLMSVTTPQLVHVDYHFHNIQYHDGKIVGIYDFEWAMAGDCALDLKDVAHFELYNTGSKAAFEAGYQSLRPYPDQFQARCSLYEILYQLELIPVALRYWQDGRTAERIKKIERLLSQLGQ